MKTIDYEEVGKIASRILQEEKEKEEEYQARLSTYE